MSEKRQRIMLTPGVDPHKGLKDVLPGVAERLKVMDSYIYGDQYDFVLPV
jgi:hypothetical protein